MFLVGLSHYNLLLARYRFSLPVSHLLRYSLCITPKPLAHSHTINLLFLQGMQLTCNSVGRVPFRSRRPSGGKQIYCVINRNVCRCLTFFHLSPLVRRCVYAYLLTYLLITHLLTHVRTYYSLTYLLAHLSTYLPYSLTDLNHLLTYLPTYSRTYLLTYLLTYVLTYLLLT
jgi:hypothetical protein